MDDLDLRDALERDIGDGPPLPAPATRLPGARAALRRRRAGIAAASVVAVAAVAVPVAVLGGGSQPSGPTPVPAAPAPTPSPPAKPSAEPDLPPFQWLDDSAPAALDSIRGTVHVRPRATVHERRWNLFPGKDTESLALDLTWRGTRHWMLFEWDEGGGGSVSTGPGDGFVDSFDAFITQQVAGGGMTRRSPRGERLEESEAAEEGTVVGLRWTPADGFTASGRTEILEATDDPRLPVSFAPPPARAAAAFVRMDGALQLVVARDLDDSRPELIAVLAEGHGDSLDELLEWARRRYDSGAGLR